MPRNEGVVLRERLFRVLSLRNPIGLVRRSGSLAHVWLGSGMTDPSICPMFHESSCISRRRAHRRILQALSMRSHMLERAFRSCPIVDLPSGFDQDRGGASPGVPGGKIHSVEVFPAWLDVPVDDDAPGESVGDLSDPACGSSWTSSLGATLVHRESNGSPPGK